MVQEKLRDHNNTIRKCDIAINRIICNIFGCFMWKWQSHSRTFIKEMKGFDELDLMAVLFGKLSLFISWIWLESCYISKFKKARTTNDSICFIVLFPPTDSRLSLIYVQTKLCMLLTDLLLDHQYWQFSDSLFVAPHWSSINVWLTCALSYPIIDSFCRILCQQQARKDGRHRILSWLLAHPCR